MLNFGLTELRLVAPRDGWPNPDAGPSASGADIVLESARVYKSVPDAIADCSAVYASTVRRRDVIIPVLKPEEMAAEIAKSATRSAILFGPERSGLETEEVALTNAIVTVPINPEFASLNLAQAVLLMGYEWFKDQAESLGQQTPELPALDGPGLQTPDTRLATKEELYGFFDHLERELDIAGFFKTEDKKPGMLRNIRNLFSRAELTEQEVRSLRGIVSSLTRAHEKRKEEREREGTRKDVGG
jgi:tRNA/rRNA methyltransferase